MMNTKLTELPIDERIQLVGSSIKASWRAKQLRGVIKRMKEIAGDNAPQQFREVEDAMEAMANATQNLRDALHEFASETDTKAVERALRQVEDVARERGYRVILQSVSAP